MLIDLTFEQADGKTRVSLVRLPQAGRQGNLGGASDVKEKLD
jgi:hypothetical protein